ncbi:MAG: shikimate kinase [Verrucomicrobiota bacterium]|jgi:shikimate kinase
MTGPRQIHNLALIGFMGTGKSSVGRLAAAGLHFELADTDHLIEQRAGKSIPEIFAEQGEAAFRAMERQLVAEMIDWRRKVISTGGGLAANAANLASLKQHALVVCLWASADGLWQRLRHQSHRPLLQGPDPLATIRDLLAERSPFYKQADVLVNTESRNLREVAEHVLHQFKMARAQPFVAPSPASPPTPAS